MDPRRGEAGARAAAECGQERTRSRLTARGLLEILAERPSQEEVRADSPEEGEEDLRAVLALESGELEARGVVR